MSNIYSGLKLAARSKFENLVIENVAVDPNPIEIGRVWFNTTLKCFRYSSLDQHNVLVIQSFASLDDIDIRILELQLLYTNIFSSDNIVNLPGALFEIPDGITLEESITLIAQEISNIKIHLNSETISKTEFYVTAPTNILSLSYTTTVSRLLVLVNGLEEASNAYSLNTAGSTIVFTYTLPVGTYIKVINFNKIL